MSVVVFPGQGAQHKGMGSGLFEKYQDITRLADQVLGYSIASLCLDDPERQLHLTQFTQPALFTVSVLHYLEYLETHEKPQYVAGHSLGEYNALFASGVIDFETGLRMVQKRGQLMSQAKNGAMMAVIKASQQQVTGVIEKHQLDNIDIANYNSPTQFVISGQSGHIEHAKAIFQQEGLFCIPLKVSGAFHSREMTDISAQYHDFIKTLSFNHINIPIVSNVTARLYKQSEITKLLTQQIVSSVQWIDSIRYLMAKGQEQITEVGPGNVLTKLNADIISNCSPLDLMDEEPAFAQENSPIDNTLGSQYFLNDYQVEFPYVAGSMCHGISSVEWVAAMASAGFLSYFGSHGLAKQDLEQAIHQLKIQINDTSRFGMNISYENNHPEKSKEWIELFLATDIRNIELSGFTHVTEELVKFRLKGLQKHDDGQLIRQHKLLVKTDSIDVASLFMSPPPPFIVHKLLEEGVITPQQAEQSSFISMADDICVEGDTGWRTNRANILINLPLMIKRRDQIQKNNQYANIIRVGAAGGLGTPSAMVAMFILGADFVLTGSINQCTKEANIADSVKDILQKIEPEDVCHAPYGEQFESGEVVQIIRKGMFFPARAQKLFDLYRLYDNLNQIEQETITAIEQHYFNNSLNNVYQELIDSHQLDQNTINKSNQDPKFKMALIFRSYFNNAAKSIQKDFNNNRNHQIFSSQALGAFNQLVKNTELEDWRQRSVSRVAMFLIEETKKLLAQGNPKAA